MPTFQSDDAPIHYEVHGDESAPALLLIHAISAGADMWEPQVQRFSTTHRVIVFDARGAGRSGPIRGWRRVLDQMSDDVRGLLDHLGCADVVVCGVSFGGVLAQHVATRYPERVSGLVIADSYSDTRPTSVGRALWLASVYAGSVANLLPRETLRRVMAQQYRRWPLAASYLGDAVARLRKIDALKTRLAINLVNYVPALRDAGFPVLVIVGESSWPRSITFAEELRAAVPRAQLVRIPDSNDPSSLCQPEAFNTALSQFLEQIPTRGEGGGPSQASAS